MWVADNWKDYEVLDASSGEKLERWGKYILIRPDPQVIWDTEKNDPGWKKRNAHYHRSSKGGGSWEFFDLPEEWKIGYELRASGKVLSFNLKPFSFKHTGLFPEQALNWEWMTEKIRNALKSDPEREIKVLNLFAYTGGATAACAGAGAKVTHVDASKGMVNWAKENCRLSRIPEERLRFFVDDCLKLVEREIRRGNSYDGIVMDPPSYGRGPKGEIWKMEENVFHLIKESAELLSSDPLFFLINSYTTGLQPGVLKYMTEILVGKRFKGKTEADEIGLPVRDHGLVLPCGASCRWSRDQGTGGISSYPRKITGK